MKRILVPVDFSRVTDAVIRTATAFAKAFSGEIFLLHVCKPEPEFLTYEPGPPSVRQAVAQEIAGAHLRLHALAHAMQSEGVPTTALVIQGYIVEKILQELDRLAIDLVVMGSHGHGALYHLLLGSVSEGVVRKAKCPVVIVPSDRAESELGATSASA